MPELLWAVAFTLVRVFQFERDPRDLDARLRRDRRERNEAPSLAKRVPHEQPGFILLLLGVKNFHLLSSGL
jgi:hypothetical protein